jgi:uncharacterized protein HemX
VQKAWGWIVAAVVFLVGVALAIYFRSLGDKRAAANARADAIEKNADRRIKQKRVKIEKLKGDLKKNQPKIDKLEEQIAKDKGILEEKFTAVGLSAEEAAARLNKIRL